MSNRLSTLGLCLALAWSATAAAEDRLVDDWPKLLVSAGLTYSPAPHLSFFRDGHNLDEKLPDQVGGRIGIEGRLAGYLLLGGELLVAGNPSSVSVEGGALIGALVPLSDYWALYGHGRATIAIWKTGDEAQRLDLDETLYGLQVGLAAGVRFKFPCGFMAWLELGGLTGEYSEDFMTLEGPGEGESVYRLNLALGAAYGW